MGDSSIRSHSLRISVALSICITSLLLLHAKEVWRACYRTETVQVMLDRHAKEWVNRLYVEQ